MSEYPRDLLITEDVIREFEEKVGVRFINKTECAEALTEHDRQVIEKVIKIICQGLNALKDKGYDTYSVDAELKFLEQLKEQNDE